MDKNRKSVNKLESEIISLLKALVKQDKIQLDDNFDDNSWKKNKLPLVATNKRDTSRQLITKITALKECFQSLKVFRIFQLHIKKIF